MFLFVKLNKQFLRQNSKLSHFLIDSKNQSCIKKEEQISVMFLFYMVFRWIIWIETLVWMYFNLERLRTSQEEKIQQFTVKLKRCGILGIKIGQYMSNRHEFLGRECCEVLANTLLDKAKPHHYQHTLKTLDTYNKEFIKVDKKVLGSGSLAQVHSCRLRAHPDQEYVVKVLHPNVLQLHDDLWFFQKILPILSYITKFNIHWDDLLQNIRIQTDLCQEADNMRNIRQKCRHFRFLDIPRAVLYTKSFIVMTKCQGKSSYKHNASQKLLMYQAGIFFYLTLLDGTFHGNMHAGNILIQSNKTMSLLDFGLCPTIPATMLYQYVKLMNENSFCNFSNVLNTLCIYPISEHTLIRIYDDFKKNDMHSSNNLSVILKIMIDLMITYRMVPNANVTMWMLQYSYLEKQLQHSEEIFILRIVRFMSEIPAFRVNLPCIDVLLLMLNHHEKARIIVH